MKSIKFKKHMGLIALSIVLTVSLVTGTALAGQGTLQPAAKTQTSHGAKVVDFTPTSSARSNGNQLYYALQEEGPKTIVIKEGSNFKIDRVLYLTNDTKIIAKNCTITQIGSGKNIFVHEIKGGNYQSLKNVEIDGGTWQTIGNKAIASIFRFAHADGIKIKNATVYTNYQGHGIGFIACRNSSIDNCKVIAKTQGSSKSLEEAIQLDVASKATAPFLAREGSKYVQGQTCNNIKITNCTIHGSRGLTTNHTKTENNKWINKYHSKITVTGNNITSTSSEALVLHNAVGLTVKNNKITTPNKRLKETYSIGLNIALLGKNKIASKYSNVISGNTIKGGRQGLHLWSYTSSKYGKTTVTNNKCYARTGAKNAIKIGGCKSVVNKGNKSYKY
ncbi:MAG: hypothetical protein RR967_06510 [Anaerovoracaceae bacterium]